MHRFWNNVRQFFSEINRQIYQSRRIEWKLIEDRSKLEDRAITFPLLAFVIEITCKPVADHSSNMDDSSKKMNFSTHVKNGFTMNNSNTRKELYSKNMYAASDTEDLESKNSSQIEFIVDKFEIDKSHQTSKQNMANLESKKVIPQALTSSGGSNILSISRRREIELVARIENLANLIGDSNPLVGKNEIEPYSDSCSSYTDITIISENIEYQT
jgi:hypothetical protein